MSPLDRDALLGSSPVEPLEPEPMNFRALLSRMGKTAAQGRRLGEAYEVIRSMLKDDETTVIMGLAGSMATSGMWRGAAWLIERGYVDVLVTTGANVSEDIYAGLGYPYAHIEPCVDDKALLELRLDRFYDVVADELLYREMERLLKEFFLDLPDGVYSSAELLYLLGARLHRLGVPSIASSAYKVKTPVFVPAIVDSAYGIAALQALRLNGKRVLIDQLKDFDQLVRIVEESPRTGVLYVGGGVPKDFVQLAAVAKGLLRLLREGVDVPTPHHYAVQITADAEYWGGLSGATLSEAVSWGKVSERLKADVRVDATIALPVILVALAEENVARRKKAFDWVFEEVERLVDRVA